MIRWPIPELGQKSAKDVELFYVYYIQNRNRCMSISQLALNGKDIIEATNLRGKQIQEALNMCLKYAFIIRKRIGKKNY